MDSLLGNRKQGDSCNKAVFPLYGFKYSLLSWAGGVETEPAASGGALGAGSWHGDVGLCIIARHLQCLYMG